MSNTPKEQTAEYNPIYCEHRKENGLSGYTLLSHSSGSGPNFQHQKHLSICLLCGNIRISGHDLKDGQIHKYNEEISIDLPDAVAAIVKNCNYMNRETEGYIPFVQVAAHLNQPLTEDKQPGETIYSEYSRSQNKYAAVRYHLTELEKLIPNRQLSQGINHAVEEKESVKGGETTDLLQLQKNLRDVLFVRPFDMTAIESVAVKLCDAVICAVEEKEIQKESNR